MQIHITATAQDNLGALYAWHREYSQDYADKFHDEIVAHLLQIQSDNPRVGHAHNATRGLYRLIYKRRYNVYYTIDGTALYILFIIDGRMLFNSELAESDVVLPGDDSEEI
jgi:plasmid stabilization system protein ParE